jgi:uncharacterized Tic20 family protein
MSEPISSRHQRLAIACYLSGIVYLLTLLPAPILAIWFPQAPAYIQDAVPSWITWQLTYKTHPFVKSAGQTAFNLTLNLIGIGLLLSLLWIFVVFSICGIYGVSLFTSTPGGEDGSRMIAYVTITASVVIGLVALTHLVFSLRAIAAARNSEIPAFPIYRFLK